MEKIKVLLIEDEEDARKQLAKLIRKEGFDVITAEDGKVGLETFHTEKPSIVITDLHMPNIDGIEVMHTVKRLSPHVQVIIITGFQDAEYPIMAIREGVLDFLKKPLDVDELTCALGNAREKLLEAEKSIAFPAILLAEDDEKTGERLSRVLKKENWRLFWVKDGEEALRVFLQEKIDIVLLDINMPKKNGIQTLHEMRALSADFEAIILTGYGDESNAIQALRNGAFNFVRKPIELEELIMCIQRALDKQKVERSLKYRTRELELSRQAMAVFSKDNGIVVDTRYFTENPASEFAVEVLETLPFDMVVFSADGNIKFINKNFAARLGVRPEKIDDDFFEKLKTMGVLDLTAQKIVDTVKTMSTSPLRVLEKIFTGVYSYVLLLPITLITGQGRTNEFLMVVRGERK
jgi:DNA-binding response OmpR family regulator